MKPIKNKYERFRRLYSKIVYNFFWTGILICASILSSSAQKTKTQLEKEKEENLKKIRETNKILNETKNRKKATIGQLSVIQEQIAARNSLILSISDEIALLDQDIFELQDITSSLENDLNLLKREYSAMIYSAAKSQNYYDRLTFIFSSQTFNQLLKRVKYFKQYSEARKMEVKQIQIVKAYLQKQKTKLNEVRDEKNQLLITKTIETQSLTALKDEQSSVLQELNSKEKELKVEIKERKNADQKLEKLITDLIKAEREKALKEAKKSTSTKKGNEALELSTGSFANSATKLPWPVVHGNISHKFGKQPHPILKGVFIENLGVDIQTLKNEQVRSVFKGKVITVATVPGMNSVVMIQHGEYFTVYAKLKSVSVATGQEVKAKDIIGEVFTDQNQQSELQFQIWKNNEKLDPEKWIAPK